jgi:hypothetical protein
MKFTKHQLKKIAEQIRLASWAQGAILYSDLHLFTRDVTIGVVSCLWVILQITALIIDKNDIDNNGNEGDRK